MTTKTLLTLAIIGSIIMPITSQAATIRLFEDDLKLQAEVWWDEPNTPTYSASYSGSVFGPATTSIWGLATPAVMAGGEILCSDAANNDKDGQVAWSIVTRSAQSGYVDGTSSTSYGEVCNEHDGIGKASIEIDWMFKVEGSGATIDIGDVVPSPSLPGYQTASSYRLYDDTADVLIANVVNDMFSNPIAALIDSHQYSLSIDWEVTSSGDPDPDPTFYVHFRDSVIVPEPETYALLGIGVTGIFFARKSTKKSSQT